MSQFEHKAQAPASVACYVLTVSDSRTPDTDTGGRAIRDLLEGAGHLVTGHAIVKDEPGEVAAKVHEQVSDSRTQVIITTGGTGITSRDSTYEVVSALIEKRLDGFGWKFPDDVSTHPFIPHGSLIARRLEVSSLLRLSDRGLRPQRDKRP